MDDTFRVAPSASADLVGDSLRAIFDGSYELVGLLSADGILLEANRTALDFGGVTREEVVGRPFWDTIWWRRSPEAQARLRQAVAAAARGEFVRYEVEQHGAGGRVAIIDFSLKPVTDAAGRVVYIIPEGRDVSERRRAEEAVRASEARFSGIVALAAEAIVSIDDAQRITLFNQSAEAIFGYRAEEVLGEPLDLLLPEEYREAHRAHVVRFAASPETTRRMAERRLVFGRRKDGSRFPAEASISKQSLGAAHAFTVVLRDITQRVQAEAEKSRLLARETLARAAAESAERRMAFLAEAGALLDTSLDYQETLASLAQLLVPALGSYCVIDIVEDGGLRRVMAEHASPDRRELARRSLAFPRDPARPFVTRPALQTGRPELVTAVTDEDLRRIAYDPEHLAILRELGPTSYMDLPLVARGSVIGAIVLATDERSVRRYGPADLGLAEELARRAALALDNARLYRAAQRATRLRDEMLGVVSHDLRTPLSVVGMSLRALDVGAETGPAERQLAVHAIRDALDWLQRMLQDLLDVASIEAGRLRVELRPQDPLITLIRAVDAMEPAARERSITLSMDVPEHLPTVRVDGERLLQVLTNLLGNAVKFTAPGGRITLRASADGGELHVAVVDTGPGMPPEDLPHVFDRFWHARRSAAVRGTGLGLTIAKGIVEAHAGRLWVTSTLGVGSEFHVALPIPADAGRREDARALRLRPRQETPVST